MSFFESLQCEILHFYYPKFSGFNDERKPIRDFNKASQTQIHSNTAGYGQFCLNNVVRMSASF